MLTLLSHFKDADGGPVSTLIGQLEELSKRTQVGEGMMMLNYQAMMRCQVQIESFMMR